MGGVAEWGGLLTELEGDMGPWGGVPAMLAGAAAVEGAAADRAFSTASAGGGGTAQRRGKGLG